jgi:hypothetical protein
LRVSRLAAVAAFTSSLLISMSMPASADAGPVVTSTGLTDGQLVGRQFFFKPVFAGDADVVEVQVLAGGKEIRRVSAAVAQMGFTIVQTRTSVQDDTDMDITVRAYDASGRAGEKSTRVHIDIDPPTAVFQPAAGTLLHGRVEITASEISADATSVVLSDSATGQQISRADAAPWTLPWDTSALTGDRRSVLITVTDGARNVSTFPYTYSIDNVGPVIRSSGLPGRVGPGVNWLYVYPTDISGVDRMEWWVGGTLRSTAADYAHDFGPSSGVVPVTYIAWDKLGQQSTTTVNIEVDAVRPTVTWLSPANGALIRGNSITSRIRVDDDRPLLPIASLNGVNGATAEQVVTGTTFAGNDGKRDLIWVAEDGVGNAVTARRTVIVDNTRPTLKVTKAPKNNAKVKGTVKVTAAAWDRNGVARVELLVNGKVVARDVKAGYAFSINTRKFGKKIKIQLRAYDRAGNSQVTTTRTWRR